jgi:hypothetical protein
MTSEMEMDRYLKMCLVHFIGLPLWLIISDDI